MISEQASQGRVNRRGRGLFFVLATALVSVSPANPLFAPAAQAQIEAQAQIHAQLQAQIQGQRVVSGVAVNDAGTLLPSATVFIKDLKTKSIRSYTTPTAGTFRFTQVNMGEDHEVWAEKDGKKSAVKTVSVWDTRKVVVYELKVQ